MTQPHCGSGCARFSKQSKGDPCPALLCLFDLPTLALVVLDTGLSGLSDFHRQDDDPGRALLDRHAWL